MYVIKYIEFYEKRGEFYVTRKFLPFMNAIYLTINF